jgi:hypothetical protein
MQIRKREFLTAGVAAGMGLLAGGAAAPVPKRMAKLTKLFDAPGRYPNAIAVAPEGLWIAQQVLFPQAARGFAVPVSEDPSEVVWLVDWTGKVLKTVKVASNNTSGMAYGDGYLWNCVNGGVQGIYQTDLNGKLIAHRQFPLGTPTNGGGCHGALYHDGKLWVAVMRLHGLVRIDPRTWQPEFVLPIAIPNAPEMHGMAWDNGAIWVIIGDDKLPFTAQRPALAKYDAATGQLLETVDFVAGSGDLHGLAMHDGQLIGCDSGIRPGWPGWSSPTSGQIVRVDFV